MHGALRPRDPQNDSENSPLHELRSALALVIDVNPTSRSNLKGKLADLGVPSDRVKQVGWYLDARIEPETTQYDVVLCDFHFDDTQQTGADLIDELRQGSNLPYATVFNRVTSEASCSREFAQPDHDIETAGNMMSLLLRLRASELELPDAELWIEKLARRFCINKGMTDMLAMMVHEHEHHEAIVRDSHRELAFLAETSLSRSKAGEANPSITELVNQGTTTANTRMIELADMLRQRYHHQALEPEVLHKREELKARYVRKPAPIKLSR